MAYVDIGSGAPLVFLDGNPTSSYLWRNVIAPLSASYRCIAPDLIGMGDSEKLPDTGPQSYTLAEHARRWCSRERLVEKILPRSILRSLTDEEMTEYRRPVLSAGEDRRPTLSWPRQMPFDGSPADVVQVVERYGEWLASSGIPKLLVNAEPGAILTGDMREFCRTWPNQTEVTVNGIHFIQEDSPQEIAQALSAWLTELPVVDRS